MALTKKRAAELGKELAALSMEELEARAQELDEQYAEIRDEKRAVQDALGQKVIEEQALARLETMSDPERAVLLQHLQTEGIKPKSKVGTPGGDEE